MKFSIICVYNNKTVLGRFLLSGLKKQSQKYQLILIDNTKNQFKSAASALNYGAKKAQNQYLMFVHQDVVLKGNDWLKKAENFLDQLSDLGIAGVAGMSEWGKTNQNRGRNIIYHGNPPEKWSWGNQISKPEIVQTLDECLLIIPKKIFGKTQFDQKICHNWHLYGVDYCLSIRGSGNSPYILPLSIYHQSSGESFSKKYYQTLSKILKKHRKKYRTIFTTMGEWNTIYPLFFQRVIKKLGA